MHIGRERADGDHIITISPPLILENVLLCDMEYALVDSRIGTQQKGLLARGDQVFIHQLDPYAELKLTIAIPGIVGLSFIYLFVYCSCFLMSGYKRSMLVNITGPNVAKKIDLPPSRTNAHHLYVNLHNRYSLCFIRMAFQVLNEIACPFSV